MQNPWQASLAILSAFFLTPRPATSSSHPSLTFLGWDKDDDDHHNNHDDQHLCSPFSVSLEFQPGGAGGQGLLQLGILVAARDIIHVHEAVRVE